MPWTVKAGITKASSTHGLVLVLGWQVWVRWVLVYSCPSLNESDEDWCDMQWTELWKAFLALVQWQAQRWICTFEAGVLFMHPCGLLLIHLFISCIVSWSMFKPKLVCALPGYVSFNYGGCVGNRALSEVRATKPLISCALLKVQPFLFLDVEIYLLHWSRGSPGTVHVFLSCSQTLLLRVILHPDNISDLLLWFLFCMLTWMGQLLEYNMPNVRSIIYVNPVTLEVSGVFASMTRRLGLWWVGDQYQSFIGEPIANRTWCIFLKSLDSCHS